MLVLLLHLHIDSAGCIPCEVRLVVVIQTESLELEVDLSSFAGRIENTPDYVRFYYEVRV